MTKTQKKGLFSFLNRSDDNSGDTEPVSFKNEYMLLQKVPMEVAVYNSEGKYEFVNELYLVDAKLRKSILGKDDDYFFKLMGISSDSSLKRKENFARVLTEKKTIRFTEELYFHEKNKSLYYKRYYQPIFKDNESKEISHICFFGSNLTAVVLSQKELKYLAYHDKLTGLRNRDAFYEQLDQILLESERDAARSINAVLFCDLDNFKLVNDTLGHDIGDMVLKEAAKRMNDSLRKSDYVFRLGGDEFTVIARRLKQEFQASTVAERLIKNLSEPYFIKNHKITYLTPSIGIVFFPRDGKDRETLVKNADIAMYNAKKRGKNNYQFFSKDMTDKSMNRLKIENNLRTMVKDKTFDKQLKMVYQPIIEKKTNGDYKVVGSEALVRWQNPELGAVPPVSFIPIAEENNLINRLGDWIFNKTCQEFNSVIRKINPNLYVSINLSAKQLKSTNMIKSLERILKASDIDPKYIQLELTETSYLDDQKEVITNINELNRLGIKLAIDDFGIGFASLVYLHKIPATSIKIDRSFIQHIGTSEKNKELVKSIIVLGQNLNKEVIAEGVEEPEHLAFLGAQKCYKYQGYLFSKPLDLADFGKLVEKDDVIFPLKK
ncbi:MAG: putative bifunctional diguanylate cyclase/phosphodiesterase [Calditrichaceae bacterium]